MEQKYAVIVLFALIVASGLVSLTSYRATEHYVTEDMSRALALTLEQQQSDVISADTIQVFNRHLRTEALRGRAVLAVDTRQGFRPYAQCSRATIFALSDQRPALALWVATLFWGLFCLWHRRRGYAMHLAPASRQAVLPSPSAVGATQTPGYGGLSYSEADGRFYDEQGVHIRLTPMQQQLLEMFFRKPSHLLTKAEICNALWPKKDDASDTLYTLIRRLKPIVEQHSRLKIEADRGRAYELKEKSA